jgi:hypothetical protein
MWTYGTKRTIAALQQFVRYWGNNGHAKRVLANLKTENLRRLFRLGSSAEPNDNPIAERV